MMPTPKQPSSAALLQVVDVAKRYGETPALRGVSLDVAEGAIVCLLGPSGCGKTTLLRVIAGLEQPDSGEVRFAGQPLGPVPAHRRGFGLMFQDYALFPHRNVTENVAFGLRMQNLPHAQIEARVAEMLGLVGLDGYQQRRVYELSGGERQRVALARSLAPRPRLLMLDEPLGALDRALRERLLGELRVILKEVGVTSIYVTHDQAEAYAIADWLVLMNSGLIEQHGPPEEVYRRPTTVFAARFLGHTNLVPGTLRSLDGDLVRVDTALGELRVADGSAPGLAGAEVTLAIRPEAAELAQPGVAGPNVLDATVRERSFRGSRQRITVCVADQELECELDGAAPVAVGESVRLRLRPEGMSVIRTQESGVRSQESGVRSQESGVRTEQ